MKSIKFSIYKIYSDKGSKIYIGSTVKTLETRFYEHKNDFNNYKSIQDHFCSSFILFSEYGINNCYMVELESYHEPIKNILIREREWLDKFILNTVNINKPIRYPDERKRKRKTTIFIKHNILKMRLDLCPKIYLKRYNGRKLNGNRKCVYARKYYSKNCQRILSKQRNMNEDKLKKLYELNRTYHEKHKEQINTRARLKYHTDSEYRKKS